MVVAKMQSSGNGSSSSNSAGNSESEESVNVWAKNLEEEFAKLRQVVQKYRYVAMDTEFPGVVAKPTGEFRSASEYQYQLVKCNVDLLKLIQVGLTFFNEDGGKPSGIVTFQFNLKFSLQEDMYAQDSIDMLTAAGIQFKRHEEEGIEVEDFAELLMTSGLVLREEITWITFASSYDFGYLIRVLTSQKLPDEENEFFELMSLYFPKVYDVKYLMKSCKSLKGGLQEVGDSLELERVGAQHQAGSDSDLTGGAFFKIKQLYFDDHINEENYCGYLFGLRNTYSCNGNGYTVTESSQ